MIPPARITLQGRRGRASRAGLPEVVRPDCCPAADPRLFVRADGSNSVSAENHCYRTQKSAEGRYHLLVCRELAGRLLGVGETAIDGNLEYSTTRPAQPHLCAWHRPFDQTCRRTGARFVASHAAIFDLDLHQADLLVVVTSVEQQPPLKRRIQAARTIICLPKYTGRTRKSTSAFPLPDVRMSVCRPCR